MQNKQLLSDSTLSLADSLEYVILKLDPNEDIDLYTDNDNNNRQFKLLNMDMMYLSNIINRMITFKQQHFIDLIEDDISQSKYDLQKANDSADTWRKNILVGTAVVTIGFGFGYPIGLVYGAQAGIATIVSSGAGGYLLSYII